MKTREIFNVIRNYEWVYKTLIGNALKQHRTALDKRGFTLLELLIVVAILAILSIIALPSFTMLKDVAKNARAETEIRSMEKAIALYAIDNYALPDSLNIIPGATLIDPWGKQYVYNKLTGPSDPLAYTIGPSDQLNTDYDLYSTGKNGLSTKEIYDTTSTDDIVRCGNLGKVVVADKYDD